MILNTWTVLALLVAFTSVMIAGVLVLCIARAMTRRGLDATQREDTDGALLGLLLGTLLTVQALALPLCYWLLKSYVPHLAHTGVMCAYGVSETHPRLVDAMLALGPFSLFLGGLWFVKGWMGIRTLRPLLAAATGASAIGASIALALFIFADKGRAQIACCSEAFGGAQVAGTRGASAALSEGAVSLLHLGLASAQLLLGAALARTPARRGTALPWITALLALASAPVTLWFWRDALSPRVLGLPYHRCAFELLTDTRALGVAALFTVTGHFLLLWPPLTGRALRREELQPKLYVAALLALISAHLIVAVHWIPVNG